MTRRQATGLIVEAKIIHHPEPVVDVEEATQLLFGVAKWFRQVAFL